MSQENAIARPFSHNRLQWHMFFLLMFVVCFALALETCIAFGIADGRKREVRRGPNNVEPCNRNQESFSISRRELIQATGSSITTASVLVTVPQSLKALSPRDASTAYDKYASSYDELDGGAASSILGLDEARSQTISMARGKVLEIGVGTGLNLRKYNPALVTNLTLVDISEGMLQEANAKVESLNLAFPVHFVKADATSQLVDLFGENAFDAVVDSFSLCVMGNDGAKECLKQLTQVVKKQSDGGRVLLLENSRSSNPILGFYQDVTADAAASAGGKGCVYNQDVAALIKNTRGLTIEKETSYIAGLFRSYVCTKAT